MIYNSYRYVKKPIKVIKIKPPKKKHHFWINIFPVILCITGLSILLYSVYPYGLYFVQNNVLKVAKEKEILVPNGTDTNAVLAAQSSANSPASYFQNASTAIENVTNTFQKDHPEYADVKGSFSLTIEKLKLKDVPTKINVESSFTTGYMEVLKSSLAHFKGSSLPGKPGNTFVYGHSARGNIFGTSWESIFSGLHELDVGDQIKLNYNGTVYKYSVTKWKITSPNDTSVVLSTSDRQTLTLMTCDPPGIGNERLIIMADKVY